MVPTTPPPPNPTSICIPYAEATPQQISLALAYSMQELNQHFPTLGFVTWANILLQLQPDLWVEGDLVYLDPEDLNHLMHRLAAVPELPELDPPIYPARAGYLAKRLVNYQDQAQEALADIEANPLVYGNRVFTLVTDLALGNSVADQVFRATHRGPQKRPGAVDPAQIPATVHEQVRMLRHARGEFGYQNVPTRPTSPAQSPASGQ
jgi:hypothetical protein